MKFSIFASTVIGAVLFVSKAAADVDFFDWPYPNAQYRPGSCIRFIVDDMPDGDNRVYANLYTENRRFVKTIRSWDDDYVDDDEFAFTWCIDRTVRPGRYFVAVFSDEDDDDDVSRSFMFTIGSQVANSQPAAAGGYPTLRRPNMQRVPYADPRLLRNRYRDYEEK